MSTASLNRISCSAVQVSAWDTAREERGVEGMARAQSNPHQDEIDAVGTFFEVEQQLAALQASSPQVAMLHLYYNSHRCSAKQPAVPVPGGTRDPASA